MALKAGAFPYDIDNLLGGAVRILYADAAGAGAADIPVGIQDVIDMAYPYAAAADWTDLGATKESFTYTRGFETAGWEIQQEQGNVIEEITNLSRTIEVSYAEFNAANLAMIEGGGVSGTVTAAAGHVAQDRLGFGAFESLNRYRFAFISRRSKASGVVIEPGAGARERGRFFMGVVYSAQLSADDVSVEQAKGELTASGVTFTAFPEAGEDAGEDWGAWYDEQPGTIGS